MIFLMKTKLGLSALQQNKMLKLEIQPNFSFLIYIQKIFIGLCTNRQ